MSKSNPIMSILRGWYERFNIIKGIKGSDLISYELRLIAVLNILTSVNIYCSSNIMIVVFLWIFWVHYVIRLILFMDDKHCFPPLLLLNRISNRNNSSNHNKTNNTMTVTRCYMIYHSSYFQESMVQFGDLLTYKVGLVSNSLICTA